jgi:soluble lytic murein transglycosylase-like protein
MSVTATFKSILLHGKGSAFSFFQNSLLLFCLLFGLGSAPAGANDIPAITAEPALTGLPAQAPTLGEESAAGDAAPGALSPRMQAALDYVKGRYKVSKEAMLPLFAAVQRIAAERQLDPLLIVAIIGIESGFNPKAKSAGGGHGLMQVIPRYHLNKIPDGRGVSGLMDPVVNVKVGAHILDDSIRRAGSTMAGLQTYNGSDRKGLFARRVLAERARLEPLAP